MVTASVGERSLLTSARAVSHGGGVTGFARGGGRDVAERMSKREVR